MRASSSNEREAALVASFGEKLEPVTLSQSRPSLHPSQIEHETWRLLLQRTRDALATYSDRIHPAYAPGFEFLFGDSEEIPGVNEVNTRLERVGWQTIPVDGYLRHDTYAALLAARVFPVARRIRRMCDINHSPVPDLAHDMIGHLPMLVDPQHREFLQRLGEVMSHATLETRDRRLYDAQRRSGYLRQSEPPSPLSAIRQADVAVERLEAELERHPSSVARLSRLYLWTIEFGLLGDCQSWVAYGAALLSSGKELLQLMSGRSKVLPLTADATRMGISFCDPQRSYYAARDHAELHRVLDRVQAQDAAG